MSDKYFLNLLRVFIVSSTAVISVFLGLVTAWLVGVVFFILLAPLALIMFEQFKDITIWK